MIAVAARARAGSSGQNPGFEHAAVPLERMTVPDGTISVPPMSTSSKFRFRPDDRAPPAVAHHVHGGSASDDQVAGRELVGARSDAMKIRAEDGRRVEGVDISGFIADLPSGRPTRSFRSDDASGSTSQAAALVEAIEARRRPGPARSLTPSRLVESPPPPARRSARPCPPPVAVHPREGFEYVT